MEQELVLGGAIKKRSGTLTHGEKKLSLSLSLLAGNLESLARVHLGCQVKVIGFRQVKASARFVSGER